MSTNKRRSDPKPLPAKQARSRETLDRLYEAADVVLARDGLDKATVAAVAEEAGVSVGIIYKRFPDKDALLRSVYERFFDRTTTANAAALEPARWEGRSAAKIVDTLVAGMVRGYFQHAKLLRALIHFAEAHPDARFRQRAEQMRRETFRGIEALLLDRSTEIDRSEKRNAIEFSLLIVGLALRGIVLEENRDFAFTQSENVLARELASIVKAYLRVS